MEKAGGVRNWTLNPCALGVVAGMAILHVPGSDDGQASLRIQAHGSWSQAAEVQRHECRVRTLDEYALALDRVDFLKCDVEGAELEVIRGGHSTLVRHMPLLWLESNPEWTKAFGYTPADLLAELRAVGYDTFLAAGDRLRPLEDRDLDGNVNLLCARAGLHAERLARLTKI
jgi:FkbM family methyltransferase